MVAEHVDVAVIGAGFGGLGAALELARGGAKVALFEALKYPGGCASTFTRRGHEFEAGATLFSGFGEGQYFRRLADEVGLDMTFVPLDPVVELRTGEFALSIPPDREEFIRRFLALPGAPQQELRLFFDKQRVVADTLWALFDDPALLPPFGLPEFVAHLARTPRYAGLLPLVSRTLEDVLKRWNVAGYEPLRIYLDAVSQITIQTGVKEAEAPFALATMDYFFRGTGHIDGGVGRLAWAMARAFEAHGGRLYMADRVTGLERSASGWTVRSRRRTLHAGQVVANMLPQDLMKMGVGPNDRLSAMARRVETGWGATMLYFALGQVDGGLSPHHYELVADTGQAFVEGNHVFCSLSGADEHKGPDGVRTMTCSTHVPMAAMRVMSEKARGVYVAGVQQKMRETIALRAPELLQDVRMEMTGSPRTFQRFTLRSEGLVGGIPRRVGWQNYADMFAGAVAPGVHLVGDSVFPGQSTLATTIGGAKLAQRLLG